MTIKYLLSFVTLCGTIVIPYYTSGQTEYGIVNSGELIRRGAELHDEEKYDQALEFYNQVPENDTSYTLALVEKALSYYSKKDYEKAVQICEEALNHDSEYDHNLYITLGSAYDDLGKPEKAIEIYDRAIKIFPKNHLLLFNKAVALEKRENYSEALDLYQEVLKICPYHASTHYRLGHLAEQEGDLVRAMLCYNTFLIAEPATDRSLSILQSLDNMVGRKYDNSKAKGVIFSKDGEDFGEIETIIRKQLALNKSYRLESKADFSVIRQNQALLSYLPSHKGQKGFWETFYVPFFARIYKEGLFEEFSYFILASSDNEKIKSLLARNKGGVSKFNQWIGDAYTETTAKHIVEVEGKPTEVTQIYYKGGSLYGIGPYHPGTDKKAGIWKFFYTSGRLMSTGGYDNTGEQTGDWKFYHPNGNLKKEVKLLAGKGVGIYKLYSTNGNIKELGSYSVGELDGEIKAYTPYGAVDEVHYFKNGLHEGKYEEYYPNGKLKFNSFYTAGKLSGAYQSYHPDGKLYIDGKVKDNLKEGLFTVYFRDGKVQLKKSYLLDQESGSFTKYYNNGKLNQEGTFKNQKQVGPWKLYFLNGQLDEITTYNEDGNETGIQQYFDVDGKLYYEAELKNGRLIQFKYFDKGGKLVAETKLKPKQEVKFYFSDGAPRWVGNLENGKRNGLWKEYDRNGLILAEYTYIDGSLNGAGKVYFYNGKVYKELNYKDGNLHGEYTEYFRNGKTYKTAWYENGIGFGNVTTYFNNGTKQHFYTLMSDNIIGKSYSYDIEGKLSLIEKYENGILTDFLFYDTTGNEIRSINIEKEKIEVEFPSITNEVLMKRTFMSGSKEGKSNSYYLENKTHSEGNFLNDERDGVWKWYNPDNSLNAIRTYQFGDLDGLSENYDLFGKIRTRSYCIEGNVYGQEDVFYYNGNKKEEAEYWNNNENGPSKYFGFNGEHVMTLLYEHGTLVKVVYVNSKMEKSDTIPAPLNGTIEAKYSNGKTAFLMEFKNGYRHGKYREFFEDGTPCRESQYLDNLLEDERKTWYRDGKLRSVESYKHNDDHGVTTLYNENGTKKAELTYKMDALHGPAKYFDASGKLIAHYIFYNDDMVKKVL
jgi:uncharacterized protein